MFDNMIFFHKSTFILLFTKLTLHNLRLSSCHNENILFAIYFYSSSKHVSKFFLTHLYKFCGKKRLIFTYYNLPFKDYFCYKAITFQNVSSEAQVKNFVISQKNYVPFSRYSILCNFYHPLIYQIYDFMMNISA